MKKFILILFTVFIGLSGYAQEIAPQHKDMVQSAKERFESKNYGEAKKNYSQLISFYPTNAEFNYKFGVCNVVLGGDPNVSIVHFKFALSSGYEEDLQYYLGRAYHRNYDFNKAILAFQKYKMSASNTEVEQREVDRYIDMCRNGKGLLSSIKDIVVLDKKTGEQDNFFRFYDLDKMGGKILAIPEELRTKQDNKNNFVGVFYFNGNSETIYYASYGKKGETGKDIYEAHLLPNGKFGRVKRLGGEINTKYDEDYAFLHADGKTMYFSSKGHNSMGGYDVFRSLYNGDTSTFLNIENMDFAVNTPDDDIFYIADSLHNQAWFSSSRNLAENKMNIYNVKVKGIPISLIFIKGNFLSDYDADMKKARIIVKDELTGRVVSDVKTNPSTGDYILSLTKPGLYSIEVGADNSTLSHEGFVQIPEFDEAVALGQELRLIKDNGLEKLIINNSFDIPLDVDISELSKEFLRRKSGLNITKEEDVFVQVDEPDFGLEKTSENSLLSAGFPKGTSVSSVVNNSETDVVAIQEEIATIKRNNKAAFSYALEKQKNANQLLQESASLMAEADNLTGDDYRKKVLESNRKLLEADDLSTDANAAYRIAKRSEKIAAKKENDVVELQNQIVVIKNSDNTNDFDALTSALRWEKNRVNAKKGNMDLNPGDIARKEARELEDVQEDLLAEVKELSDRKTSLNNKLRIKKGRKEKLTKKKEIEQIDSEILALENNLSAVERILDNKISEVRKNGKEEDILDKESEFFANQYINPDEIYLADMNVSSESLDSDLLAMGNTISSRKVAFGSDEKIYEIIRYDNSNDLAYNNESVINAASQTKGNGTGTSSSSSNETNSSEYIASTSSEDLGNYQIMSAISKEVSAIDEELKTYLLDEKHSVNDNTYTKLKTKRDNLELQQNDIYAQETADINLNSQEVDAVILEVDPRYKKELQAFVGNGSEVDSFTKTRAYRQDLKNQLAYLSQNNKKAIKTESNPAKLKALIQKDIEYDFAIEDLDNKINDVSQLKVAYSSDNKEIIDTNKSVSETLPKQIELTENYIATLNDFSSSLEEERRSQVSRERKEEIKVLQSEISTEVLEAENKLNAYSEDNELTVSTEEFSEFTETTFDYDYEPLVKSEQGVINNLRGEYSEIFSNVEDNGNMNDKVSKAINKKIYEQNQRIQNSSDQEEVAVLKMDMKSLIEIKSKVDDGQYVFVNYRNKTNNTKQADSIDNTSAEAVATTNENTTTAEVTTVENTTSDEEEGIVETNSGTAAIVDETSLAVNSDVENVTSLDNTTSTENVNNSVKSVIEEDQTDVINDEVDGIEAAATNAVESANETNSELENTIPDNNSVATNDINTSEATTDFNEDVYNQKVNEMAANSASSAAFTLATAEYKQMVEINSGFAPVKDTPSLEAYGNSVFEDATKSYIGTENEFDNLNDIRMIQGEIIALENSVISGEVENNERKLNKRFEQLYSNLAFEEIKVANRLQEYTQGVIADQETELSHLEAIHKMDLVDEDETRAEIKELQKLIKTQQKNAETKRYKITKSSDELERNFYAREAFALESDVINNQRKIITLYNNIDKIKELDSETIAQMRSGHYVADEPQMSLADSGASSVILADVKKVSKSTPLNYSDSYSDYEIHIEMVNLKIQDNNSQKNNLKELNNNIQIEKTNITTLENELNIAKNKKTRRALLEKINAKQATLDTNERARDTAAKRVDDLEVEIAADIVKAEFLFDTAKARDINSVSQNNDIESMAVKNIETNEEYENIEATTNGLTATESEKAENATDVDFIPETNTSIVTENAVNKVDDAKEAVEAMEESVRDNTESTVSNTSGNTTETKSNNESVKDNVEPTASNTSNNTTETTNSVNSNNLEFLSDTKRTGSIPMNVDVPNGTVYRIQIGAFSKPIDSNNFTEFTPMSGESTNSGLTRYFVGWLQTYSDAEYVLQGVKDLGYSDAFIVTYTNKKKTTIGESIKTTNENVFSDSNESFDANKLMAYYNSFPNAVKAELITPSSGLFFTVQIGVFSKPLTEVELGEGSNLNIDILASKKVRYSSGRFQDLEKAKQRNASMHNKGFSDSFVTAYKDGKRISISQAVQLFEKADGGSSSVDTNDSSSVTDDSSTTNNGGDNSNKNSSNSSDSSNGTSNNTNNSVDENDANTTSIEQDNQNSQNSNDTTNSNETSTKASDAIGIEKESPIVVTTVVTKTAEQGEGISVIKMEYDLLIGSFTDLPFNTRKAINKLKSVVEVIETIDGEETIYYSIRVESLQEARNLQRDYIAAGVEGTEVRAFRID